MEKLTKNQKIRRAIEAILGSWPVLRGVVDSGWREMEFKKMDEIWDFIEEKKYKFFKMTNKKIEGVMVEELYLQITRKLNRLHQSRRGRHPRFHIHLHDGGV